MFSIPRLSGTFVLFQFLFLIFYSGSILSQTPDLQEKSKTIIQMLDKKGDVYISLPKEVLSNHPEILQFSSIDYHTPERIFVYSNRNAMDVILANDVDFRIEQSPGQVDFDLNMKTWEKLKNKDLIDSWDFYPDYDAYEQMMYQFEEDYPDLVEIQNILTLPSGRSLLFAKISANVQESNTGPRFMYTSTMHGDETTGFILSLRLIHHILTHYGESEDITHMVDNLEIWICPNENPDGTYTNDNSTVYGATRSNANGYDLNRNYPNMVNNPSSPLQPETEAMIGLTDSIHFVMSANMHGGTEVVNFPWDSWTSSEKMHADHSWWEFVSREYADSARFYSPSSYFDGYDNGITHGGDWYVVYGSRQDYMNFYKNQRELTLEISDTKLLSPSLLPQHWEYNYRSLLNYIKQALYGIQGVVTDMYSGEPLEVKVEITGHDQDNTFVFSELPNGEFFRPVLDGTYDLKFSTEGYTDLIIQDVTVDNYENIFLDVKMVGDNPFAPPAELVAHTGNNNVIYLSWQEPYTDGDYDFFQPDSYRIFRNNEMVGETNETSYFDENLTSGTYEYYVKAYYVDQEGVSLPSNTVSVTLDDEVIYFTISATSGENGLIDPEGEIQVQQDHNQSFAFLPDDGFLVEDVIVDGVFVDAEDNYVFSDVSADHTIHVDFVEDPSAQEFSVAFVVTDLLSQPIDHAVIAFDGFTQAAGEYVFENVKPGTYAYTVNAQGYEMHEGELDVVDQDMEHTVQLIPVDVATQHESASHSIVFYPNPTSGLLNIKSSLTIQKLIVSDLSGRQIVEYEPYESDFDISLKDFSSGIYLISVLHNDGVYTRKIELNHK